MLDIQSIFPRKTRTQAKMWTLRRKNLLVKKKKKASILALGKHIFQQPFYTTWELICCLNAFQLSSIQIPLVTHEWEKALFSQWFFLVFSDPSSNELVHLFLTIDCFSYEKSMHSYHLNGVLVLISACHFHCRDSVFNNNEHHVYAYDDKTLIFQASDKAWEMKFQWLWTFWLNNAEKYMRNHDMQSLLLRWGLHCFRLWQVWQSHQQQYHEAFGLPSLAGRVRYSILIIRLNYLNDHLTQEKTGLVRNAPIKLSEKELATWNPYPRYIFKSV